MAASGHVGLLRLLVETAGVQAGALVDALLAELVAQMQESGDSKDKDKDKDKGKTKAKGKDDAKDKAAGGLKADTLQALAEVIKAMQQTDTEHAVEVATKVYEKLAWPYVRASGQLADNEATADTTVHVLRIITALAGFGKQQQMWHRIMDDAIALLSEALQHMPLRAADRYGLDQDEGQMWTPALGNTLVRLMNALLELEHDGRVAIAERVMDVVIGVLKSGATSTRRLVTSTLLRTVLQWDTALLHRSNWSERLWEQVKAMHAFGDDVELDSHGLLVHIVDFVMMTEGDGKQPQAGAAFAGIDLRLEEPFFEILLKGLAHSDVNSAKRAAYALRRVIQISGNKNYLVNAELDGKLWTRYFQWQVLRTKQLAQTWDAFFLVYDVLNESSVHLVEPLWPELTRIIMANAGLDPHWWSLLIRKALKHEPPIRRFCLNRLLEATDAQYLCRLAQTEWKLVLQPLLVACDESELYKTVGFSSISAFGELVVSFLQRSYDALAVTSSQVEFLNSLLETAKTERININLLVHISRFLLDHVPETVKFIGPTQLQNLLGIETNMVAERQNQKRRLMHWYLTNLVVSFADIEKLEYSLLGNYLDKIFEADLLCAPTSVLRPVVVKWLNSTAGKFKGADWYVDGIIADISAALQINLADPNSVEDFDCIVGRIGHLLLFAETSAAGKFEPVVEGLTETAGKVDSFKSEAALVIIGKFMSFAPTKITSQLAAKVAVWLPLIEERCVSVNSDLNFEQVTGSLWRLSEFCHTVIAGQPALLQLHDVQKWAQDALARLLPRLEAVLVANKKLVKTQVELASIVALITIAAKIAFASTSALSEDTITVFSKLLNVLLGAHMSRPVDVSLNSVRWRRLSDRLQPDKWATMSLLVTALVSQPQEKPTIHVRNLWSACVDALSMVTATDCEPIFKSMEQLVAIGVPSGLLSLRDIGDACAASWNVLQEVLEHQYLVLQIASWAVPVIFSLAVMQHADFHDANSPVRRFFKMMITSGEGHVTLLTVTAKQLYKVWSTDQSLPQFDKYLAEISELVLFGPSKAQQRIDNKTDELLDQETKAAAPTDHQPASSSQLQTNILERDGSVRVFINTLIAHWSPNSPRHSECARLLLEQLISSEGAQNKKVTAHNNSMDHRRKVRMWQTILVLLPFLTNDEERARRMVDLCFKHLIEYDNPMSVRYMMEFIIVRCVLDVPKLASSAFLVHWSDFNERAAVMCSMGSMSLHLARFLKGWDQVSYIQEIIPLLMPWCACNHYNVRLLAAITAQKICELAQTISTAPREMESAVAANVCNAFVYENLEYAKHREKLQEEYFYELFNPEADYCWQFIFNDVFVITNVALDDAVGADIFKIVDPSPPTFLGDSVLNAAQQASRIRGHYNIDVRHIRRQLGAVEGPELEPQPEPVAAEIAGLPAAFVPTASASSVDDGERTNYQRKIQPWELLLQSEQELTRDTIHVRQRNDLIVIASLIDKQPNLGGICRTCEIFNASKLILDDIRVKETTAFKAVSVTSENWMPMEEVRVPKLQEYLLELQQQGYQLLGVEQTGNSVGLETFNFPRKTALVLGREKEGIPVEIINLLDACIEIPQFGIVRSLNVHVSGAIMIWEYTRQHLVN